MTSKSALKEQIGGDHYKTLPIQPMTYSIVNGLNACQHTAIKYITRYRSGKGSPLENIDKAIHTLELLKELEGLSGELPSGYDQKQPVPPYSETEDFVMDFSEDLVAALYRRVDEIVEKRLSERSGEYLIAPHREKFLSGIAELKGGGSDAF